MFNSMKAFAVMTLNAIVTAPFARVRRWQDTALVSAINAAYASYDEVERADAFDLGYRIVCQHPRELGPLDGVQLLVMDANQFLFDEHKQAIEIANDAAWRGIVVALHTYYPESPKLKPLAKLPNVLVAKNHRRLLHMVRRYAKLHGLPWHQIAEAAKPLKGEVNDVHNSPAEGTVGNPANVGTRV